MTFVVALTRVCTLVRSIGFFLALRGRILSEKSQEKLGVGEDLLDDVNPLFSAITVVLFFFLFFSLFLSFSFLFNLITSLGLTRESWCEFLKGPDNTLVSKHQCLKFIYARSFCSMYCFMYNLFLTALPVLSWTEFVFRHILCNVKKYEVWQRDVSGVFFFLTSYSCSC